MRVVRGVVYMTKSSGPRTEPWGTPQEEVCRTLPPAVSPNLCQEDRSVSHFTRKQRDDRYDLNQLRTEPWCLSDIVFKRQADIASKITKFIL